MIEQFKVSIPCNCVLCYSDIKMTFDVRNNELENNFDDPILCQGCEDKAIDWPVIH
jgi:hypothetical protein